MSVSPINVNGVTRLYWRQHRSLSAVWLSACLQTPSTFAENFDYRTFLTETQEKLKPWHSWPNSNSFAKRKREQITYIVSIHQSGENDQSFRCPFYIHAWICAYLDGDHAQLHLQPWSSVLPAANAIWKCGHAFVSQINMLSHPLPEAMLRSLRIKYLKKGNILLSWLLQIFVSWLSFASEEFRIFTRRLEVLPLWLRIYQVVNH